MGKRIRQKRYSLELEPHKKKLNVSLIVKLALIVAAVIIVICVGNYAVERANIRSSYLAGKEKITVGIRTDVEPFGAIDAEGQIYGFDRDVTEKMIHNIFGEDVIVEYKDIWSENAGAAIKYNQIDMAAGFIVAGTDKTSGFSMTDPYFKDFAVTVTSGRNPIGADEFSGNTVGILNSMINVATMNDYLKSIGAGDCEVKRYYDYESAMIDLDNGVIDGFVLPDKIAKAYFSENYLIGQDELFDINYSIMFPSSASAITGVFSGEISRMKDNGTMDELLQKWHLAD